MKNHTRIILVAALFFCRVLQAATCGPTVQPITPGESIWQLTSRVGVTTDVIESLIDNLAGSCDIVIGQADIGAGGVYRFDGNSGIYGVTICLKEDIHFTTSAAIELINTLLVTVDLNGHFIDGGGNPGTAAFLLTEGADTFVIKNGTVQNVDFGVLQNISPVYTGLNTTFREMSFINTGTAILMNNGIANGTTTGALRIVHCSFLNSGDVNILAESVYATDSEFFGSGAVVLVNDPSLDIGVRYFLNCTFSGMGGVQLAQAALAFFQGCVFDGTLGTAINISDITNVFINDCVIQDQVTGNGLFVDVDDNGTQIQMIDTVVQHCVGDAFVFNTPTIIACERCVAQFCGGSGFVFTGTTTFNTQLYFTNCSSLCNGAKGWHLHMCSSSTVEPLFSDRLFDTCVASGNAQEGFHFGICPDTLVMGGILRNCIANGNGGPGFFLHSTLKDFLLYGCTAIGNGSDGFDLRNTTTTINIVNSCAQNNVGVGFRNDAPLGANLCLGNTAVNNLGGNYGGIGGFDAVLVNSGAAAIAGGTPWTNASLP